MNGLSGMPFSNPRRIEVNLTVHFMALGKDTKTFLEMIKIEHSIFALPFALLGTIWGAWDSRQTLWPRVDQIIWIIVAMVSCRSAAMAFNRIADRNIDAINPRTAMRAIPAGMLSLRKANIFFLMSLAIFVFAASQLSPLALTLSPVALLFTLGYSLTKRFTWLCHWVLGFSLGIAPAAAYLAITNTITPAILCLTIAVMFWTAGFDLIYALQDDEFDAQNKLHSFPARFGRSTALLVSRICHFIAITLLAAAGIAHQSQALYFVGVAIAACLLIYEQLQVKPNDLSKVNLAFFTLNGYVSIGVFVFAFIERWLGSRGGA